MKLTAPAAAEARARLFSHSESVWYRKRRFCIDCGIGVSGVPERYFMVTDAVWAGSGLGPL